MASNINPYNIDGTFPVAGQDNPSQGFRDNFTNIKNNFLYAQSELSDLQGKAILTGALTGQTLSNDMAGTVLRRPQLAAWTQNLIQIGTVTGSQTLDFNLGNFQYLITSGPINLTLANWPSSVGAGALGYGLMRVWISVANASHTITLPSSIIPQFAKDIAGYDPTTLTITFDAAGEYIFDISSIDGGSTYMLTDVSRNHSTQAGGQYMTGYQYAAPSTNFTANINLNVSRYIMDPTTTITNGNLRLPTTTQDGTIISISSTATITNLSVWGGAGKTIKPSANITLAAGTSIEYFYHLSETAWYKTR